MSKTETWGFPLREQRQQDERAALHDCLARLDAIEHAPTPVHDAEEIDEALSAYLGHVNTGKAAQVAALHRLIASYIGSRKLTLMSDRITSHLTAVLQRLDGDA